MGHKASSPLNTQIATLYREGYSAEQIALSLNLDTEAVEVIIKGLFAAKQRQTMEERYGDVQDVVMQTLLEVCRLSENDSARVRAAELLDEKINHGAKHEFDYEILKQKIDASRRIVEISEQSLDMPSNNTSSEEEQEEKIAS